ncbi:hypothetical protein RhiirC2_774765 [Rhizophagus irregularis]|uniref:Uncharacterized protein n=1 Tax=Rhizophagus irregularis TaxID=588596 RepID=A0A2N1NKK0_9GLOM|nr:hypothetical protein RhiirC2_774765 [Rhizophagus irregularis]
MSNHETIYQLFSFHCVLGISNKQSYRGFLEQNYHNIIVASSFSNLNWNDFNSIWSHQFLIEAQKLDQNTFAELEKKCVFYFVKGGSGSGSASDNDTDDNRISDSGISIDPYYSDYSFYCSLLLE